MELTGKIRKIEEIQVISEKFKKRNFWLETSDDPMYPQVLEIALTQKNVDIIDTSKTSKYKVGDEVKVHFNLKGRINPPKNGNAERVFNSIEAWRFESVNSGSGTASKVATPVAETAASDDLPF